MRTSFKQRAGAAALAFLLATGASSPARAAGLALPGTHLELPFEYHVREHRQAFSNASKLKVSDSYELEVTSGEATGETIVVSSSYVTISPEQPGLVSDLVRNTGEKAAKEAGTRDSRLLRLDGFEFLFLDAAATGDYSRRMLVHGAINGALYTVAVFARSDVTLTPELALRLTTLHIDYAPLLRMGSRMDEEARLATDEQGLTTPMGTLSLEKDTHARLIGSKRVSGPDGRVTFRQRTFGLGREQGFFSTAKYLQMEVGCGAVPEWNYDDYIRMVDRPKENGKPRLLKSLEPATVAGHAGRRSLALEKFSVIRRMAAQTEDTHFAVEIEHVNADRLAGDLGAQLSAPASCELDLVFAPDAGATPSAGTAPSE